MKVGSLIKEIEQKFAQSLNDQQVAIEELTALFNLNKVRVDLEMSLNERLKDVKRSLQ